MTSVCINNKLKHFCEHLFQKFQHSLWPVTDTPKFYYGRGQWDLWRSQIFSQLKFWHTVIFGRLQFDCRVTAGQGQSDPWQQTNLVLSEGPMTCDHWTIWNSSVLMLSYEKGFEPTILYVVLRTFGPSPCENYCCFRCNVYK